MHYVQAIMVTGTMAAAVSVAMAEPGSTPPGSPSALGSLAMGQLPSPPRTVIPTLTLSSDASASGRYFFNLLDHRSVYGKGWFPEKLTGPDLEAENELRLDYRHSEKRHMQSDEIRGEVEWRPGNGNLTLEIEAPAVFLRESDDTGARTRTNGFDHIEVSARHPIFQYVSPDETIDYSAVFLLEFEIPTGTAVDGHDFELSPMLGHMLRIGDHISVQAYAGVEFVMGPGEGGMANLVYGAALGYRLDREQLPLPGVVAVTPLLELRGESSVNPGFGPNGLFGVAGARFNLDPIGIYQPRIGVGYEFPLDRGARDEQTWAVLTSFILEF